MVAESEKKEYANGKGWKLCCSVSMQGWYSLRVGGLVVDVSCEAEQASRLRYA